MLTLGASFHLPSVFLSMFSWSSIYFGLRHLKPQRKAEWHCRTVTALHALLVTIMTAWSCFVQGPWPFTDAGGPNTPLQVTTSIICLGYFLFDFTWCLYFQTEGIPMLLHHSLSIFGFVWTLCAGKYGTELMATVCGSEVTNPLLQLRWFLRETGRYHTMLGEVVDMVFMLSFFAIRLGVGSVLIFCYFQQPTDFMGRFGALAIYLISWVFAISIFQYALHKYNKKYHTWQRSLHGLDLSHKLDSQPLSASENQVGSLDYNLVDSFTSFPLSCSEGVSEVNLKNMPPVSKCQTENKKNVDALKNLSQRETENSASYSCNDTLSLLVPEKSCQPVGCEVNAKDVSQNGLRHRSGMCVCNSGEGLASSETLMDKGMANGVLVNG